MKDKLAAAVGGLLCPTGAFMTAFETFTVDSRFDLAALDDFSVFTLSDFGFDFGFKASVVLSQLSALFDFGIALVVLSFLSALFDVGVDLVASAVLKLLAFFDPAFFLCLVGVVLLRYLRRLVKAKPGCGSLAGDSA
jgi:nitrate reductase gamma subunit